MICTTVHIVKIYLENQESALGKRRDLLNTAYKAILLINDLTNVRHWILQ
jgi:hypothetical protein